MTDQNELDLTRAIAEFVVEALELEDSPESLLEEIEPFQREANAGISTIELQSSSGVLAFLVYHYLIEATDGEGQTGADRFEKDLKVIERATKLDTPGPRILAHALRDDRAYILATSPATHRLLTGAPEPAEDVLAIPRTPEEAENLRRNAAAGLSDTLRQANRFASTWLAAVRTNQSDDQPDAASRIDFNEEETELAMLLLDQSNVRELLQVMNLMIEGTKTLTSESPSTD